MAQYSLAFIPPRTHQTLLPDNEPSIDLRASPLNGSMIHTSTSLTVPYATLVADQ